MMKIAVLALQGAFAEHSAMLRRLGAEPVEIRQLKDWNDYISCEPAEGKGLILPGGESTVQARLMHDLGLFEPIRRAILDDKIAVFGTCAGMILLSEMHLGTMKAVVRRNAYGRQSGSFRTVGAVEGIGTGVPMTFIRAPFVERTTDSCCTPIAEVDGNIVAIRQGRQLATAFHPELDEDTRIHSLLLGMAAEGQKAPA